MEPTQRGLGQGHLRAAAELAQGRYQASQKFDQEMPQTRLERAAQNRLVSDAQEQDLYRWAKANRLLLDAEEFERNWENGPDDGSAPIEGAENRVYPIIENGCVSRWRKANDAWIHERWDQFFQRLALHNALLSGVLLKAQHAWACYER